MRKRARPEEIRVYMTAAEKNQIQRMAGLADKSMTEYMLNSALAQSVDVDSAKIEFYQNINTDLTEIKKNLLVVTQILLTLGTQSLPINEEAMMEVYMASREDAERKF